MLPLSLSSFFLLLIPPPPTSTLFPYTTLFRSLRLRRRPMPGRRRGLDRGLGGPRSCRTLSVGSPDRAWWEDRKSTRLNSSHQIISYAVFCLKKKKKTK